MSGTLLFAPSSAMTKNLLESELGGARPTTALCKSITTQTRGPRTFEPPWKIYHGQIDAFPNALVLRWGFKSCPLSILRLLQTLAEFEFPKPGRIDDLGALWMRGNRSWHLEYRCARISYTPDEARTDERHVFVKMATLGLSSEEALAYAAESRSLGVVIKGKPEDAP